MQTIRPFIDHGNTFAIRGGGQQPAPGVANITAPGITLDLSLITGVDIDEKSYVVRIGAGERWGRVYEALDGSGQGVLGGRSDNGGIGGLALEGRVLPTNPRNSCMNSTHKDIQVAFRSSPLGRDSSATTL